MDYRASEAQTADTKAAEFAKSIKAKVDEDKGSRLVEFTDRETIDKGIDYTFYRVAPGKEGKSKIDMYNSSYTGDLGAIEQKKTEIEFIYATDMIRMADVNSTSTNMKSSFVDSLSNVINRKVDKILISKLDVYSSSITFGTADKVYSMGNGNAELEDPNTVDDLIEAAVFISTLAKESEDSEMADVAMVLTAKEYAVLNRADKIGDKFRGPKKKGHLFGCKVIKVADGVKGTWTSDNNDGPDSPSTGATVGQIYLIPRGAIGTVSHEEGIESKVWNMEGNDSLAFKIKKSFGAAVIEPQNVIRFKYQIS